MIAALSGPVLALTETAAVIECHGVGYLAHCPSRTLATLQVGQPTRLFTHLVVREDALTLFGFATVAERDLFLLLTTSVSGLGPKLGVSLLSTFSPAEIIGAIQHNQPKTLAKASGVGQRLAEKMIVELKAKLGSLPLVSAEGLGSAPTLPSGPGRDVISALMNLGYSLKQAEAAAQSAKEALPEADFATLFKTALHHAAAGQAA